MEDRNIRSQLLPIRKAMRRTTKSSISLNQCLVGHIFFRSDTGPKEAIVVIQLGRGATVAPLAARSVNGSTGFVVSLGGLFDQQQKDVMEASSFAAQG